MSHKKSIAFPMQQPDGGAVALLYQQLSVDLANKQAKLSVYVILHIVTRIFLVIFLLTIVYDIYYCYAHVHVYTLLPVYVYILLCLYTCISPALFKAIQRVCLWPHHFLRQCKDISFLLWA